jgi:hypothetical protein
MEGSPSHLIPEEASDTECTKTIAAQAEQSNKHGEKRGNVGDEGDDDVKFAVVAVEHEAG